MICSLAQSTDRDSGLLSAFHILEALEVPTEPLPETEASRRLNVLSLSINASWMRYDNDEAGEYEYEIAMKSSGDESESVIQKGTFQFDSILHRLNTVLRKLKPWTQSGVCMIESRIRKIGAERWIIQNYPIQITIRTKDSPPIS
jgi:hypothetical protein